MKNAIYFAGAAAALFVIAGSGGSKKSESIQKHWERVAPCEDLLADIEFPMMMDVIAEQDGPFETPEQLVDATLSAYKGCSVERLEAFYNRFYELLGSDVDMGYDDEQLALSEEWIEKMRARIDEMLELAETIIEDPR
jgi:cytochrome P450